MKRVGHADLRLCSGPVPHYRQIVELGGALIEYMVDEIGTAETLRKFSDPIWFEAMASAMGFEWQFSGATTVTLRAISEAIRGKEESLGLWVVGGKGSDARTVDKIPEELAEPDVTTTKVDSALVQDGYSIYFHSILYDERKRWVVVNQGMNVEDRLARRYHWSWEEGRYLNDAESIAGRKEKIVMDLQTKNSEEARKTILDIVRDEPPKKIVYTILSLRRRPGQMTLADFGNGGSVKVEYMPFAFRIPKRISEEALQVAKNAENFLELIRTPGIGPSTVRGLAFVASLVYGAPVSWKDPVKYTYAFGTKAGKPWMVEREEMVKAASFLRQAVEEAKVGDKTKKRALQRLSRIVA
ncbi:MAG: uncharacterized protein PWQ11_402 [Candidatus Diapherotrites archaeon]|nr:uncharacterized protein [Candidatus Diapherotrites archaeon]